MGVALVGNTGKALGPEAGVLTEQSMISRRRQWLNQDLTLEASWPKASRGDGLASREWS